MKHNILILYNPNEVASGSALTRALNGAGEVVNELSMLYSILREKTVDLILIAESFPGINNAILRKIRRRAPFSDIWEIVQSGYDIVISDDLPYDGRIRYSARSKDFAESVKRILSQKELLLRFGMIAVSPQMKVVAETIDRIAPTDISVLIIGPSGVGKELAAHAIHKNSRRASNKFVAVNCGALAEGVLESELFGHKKGAFTGSVGSREGLFKNADGGTIFLDEIGEMKPDLQVKLLRTLEDGSFYPVGSDTSYRTDVRVLAATNRDLNDAIIDGEFREDLYFRLGVVKIILPPLSDRRQDILPLLYYFAEKEKLTGFSETALDLLIRYNWPGNVRQLKNFVARVAALKGPAEVTVADVEQFINEQGIGPRNLPVVTGRTSEEAGHELIYHALISLGNEIRMLKDLIIANLPNKHDFEATEKSDNIEPVGSIEDMEKEMIQSILEITGGNRREAARRLGLGERTLYRKLKKYNLN